MAAARHLPGVARFPRALPGPLGARRRPGRLADGVGQRLEVVAAVANGTVVHRQPYDVPSTRRGEARGVLRTQVVAVRLGIGGKGTEDGGRVRVDVRQRRDGRTTARGPRTATYRAHDVGRYRTPDRAATTLPRTGRPVSLTLPPGPASPCLPTQVAKTCTSARIGHRNGARPHGRATRGSNRDYPHP